MTHRSSAFPHGCLACRWIRAGVVLLLAVSVLPAAGASSPPAPPPGTAATAEAPDDPSSEKPATTEASGGADSPTTQAMPQTGGATGASAAPGATGADTPAASAPVFPTPEDRAIAVGYLLDTPQPVPIIEKALELSEQLRLRYGIDSGRPLADRIEAAGRARVEFLDRLVFEEAEVVAMARKLGYTLDPAKCANFCENVRNLATLELQKLALEAFAEGREYPGRVGDPPPPVEGIP